MAEELVAGLLANLTPAHLATLFIGTALGAFIGALPGLSSISAVALVLPFTFGMDPAQGLVMLAAVYMSAEFGGSIPAILINTPGTSGAAVTTLDGYPLTRQGKAQEALYLQLFAGVVGGTLGALVLLFFTPVLARWSLLLGPSEIFWIAVAGLTLVAALTGRNILGGLIGVVLGVLLTIPGQDAVTGQLRFTYGSHNLAGGIPMVPALLGLFAVASVLALLEQREERVAPLVRRPGVIRHVLKSLLGMKKLLGWTSAVGTLVGLVPGVGNSIAAFASYAEGKRISKHPERFGKGSYEGVVAPETANNAVVGGSLVTLLGLGIPGSPAAAVMYGALTVHGLLAGPRLFSDRADIAYQFTSGVLLAVVAMLIFGLLTVRWSSMVVRVPIRLIVPGVLSLTMIGTFGLRNNMYDVIVLVIVGTVGFVLAKVGIWWVSIALGLVLGGIIENSFQQTMLLGPLRAGNVFLYWLSRPLTVVLMIIVAWLVFSGVRRLLRADPLEKEAIEPGEEPLPEVEHAGTEETGEAAAQAGDASAGGESTGTAGSGKNISAQAAPAPTGPPAAERGWVSLRTANVGLAVALIALSAYVLYFTQDFVQRAAYLPTLLCVLLLVFAGALLLNNLHPRRGRVRAHIYPFAEVPWVLWVPLVIGLVAFAFVANRIGFYESAFVYMLASTFLLAQRGRNPKRAAGEAVAFAVGMTAFLYAAFHLLLNVPTPSGLLL